LQFFVFVGEILYFVQFLLIAFAEELIMGEIVDHLLDSAKMESCCSFIEFI